jgi:beta-lactamase regulating signal transducer with metallopeptidase domain
MHLALTLAGGLGSVLLGSCFVLGLLRHVDHWSRRRFTQLQVLALPLLSLLVLGMGIRHLFQPSCFLDSLGWDHSLDISVVLLMSSTLFGAILLGFGRHLLMIVVMRNQRAIVDLELEAQVKRLASPLHLSRFRVRLVPLSRPLALLYGIRKPTILLSTWMLQHLDYEEVEAVLTHELMHLSRGDYVMNWVAMMLRDAFFYLPTSRQAYGQLLHEKEVACDDLVVHVTRRPLVLASALTKVWLHLTEHSQMPMAQMLIRKDERIADRVERLLSIARPTCTDVLNSPLSRKRYPFISILLIVVVIAIIANTALAVVLITC